MVNSVCKIEIVSWEECKCKLDSLRGERMARFLKLYVSLPVLSFPKYEFKITRIAPISQYLINGILKLILFFNL